MLTPHILPYHSRKRVRRPALSSLWGLLLMVVSGCCFAATPPEIVSGIVIDGATRAPVGGVLIRVSGSAETDHGRIDFLDKAQSEADGTFAIKLPAGHFFFELESAQFVLLEESQPFANTMRSPNSGKVTLSILQTASFSGRVLDATTGLGIAGIRVTAYRCTWKKEERTPGCIGHPGCEF